MVKYNGIVGISHIKHNTVTNGYSVQTQAQINIRAASMTSDEDGRSKYEYTIELNNTEAYLLCKHIFQAYNLDPVTLIKFLGAEIPGIVKPDKYEF